MLRLCSHWLWFWFIMEVLWLVTSRAIRQIRWFRSFSHCYNGQYVCEVRWVCPGETQHEPPPPTSPPPKWNSTRSKLLPQIFAHGGAAFSAGAKYWLAERQVELERVFADSVGLEVSTFRPQGTAVNSAFLFFYFFCCCTNTRLYPKNVLRKHTQRRVLAAASSR